MSVNRSHIAVLVGILLSLATFYLFTNRIQPDADSARQADPRLNQTRRNPLAETKLYADSADQLYQLGGTVSTQKNKPDAMLLHKVAQQPDATWLVGPSATDLSAARDIDEVQRTSKEAASMKATPLYVLYAIPHRDACAELSRGGFATAEAYSSWVHAITASLRTPSIFIVEPDAVAQAAGTTCVSAEQLAEREALLRQTITTLTGSPYARAVYLDAGHSEWFKDPVKIVEPLKRAGVDQAQGVSTNISFFAPNGEITQWSQRLVDLIGGHKGVLIDSSRNGNGLPPDNKRGVERWCNPDGRALGTPPTTHTNQTAIDAYLWIKKIGESDGACFGHQPAGVFEPNAAVQLIKNARVFR